MHTTDTTFFVQKMRKKFRAKAGNVHFGLLYLEKDFGRVPREVIRLPRNISSTTAYLHYVLKILPR